MKKIKNPPEISQNQPTIWTFYHCSSLFKYCDIVIKHCYKTFLMFSLSMFGPFRCSVFRCSVPFEVRSVDIQSFDIRSHSTFSVSMFSPIQGSVFRCSVLFDVRSIKVCSFEVQSFEVRPFEVWSFEVRSFEVRSRFPTAICVEWAQCYESTVAIWGQLLYVESEHSVMRVLLRYEDSCYMRGRVSTLQHIRALLQYEDSCHMRILTNGQWVQLQYKTLH
jgi:hypothetical protein